MKRQEKSGSAEKVPFALRLIAVHLRRPAEVGADQALYGDLVGCASQIQHAESVLRQIQQFVLEPEFDGRIEFKTTQCELPGTPDRIGAAIVAHGLGPGSHRSLKEAARRAKEALEHLQHLSYQTAQQPDLFYSGEISGKEFAAWPAPHIQEAVLMISQAASRGDVTVEVGGSEPQPLEIHCEGSPSRQVGEVSVEAEVLSVDLKSTTVCFSGRVIGGQAGARTALEKTRSFHARLASEPELRRLAGCIERKVACRVDLKVHQEGLKFRSAIQRWEPLTGTGPLELQS